MGFSASPRKKGNTAWTVERILEGAEENGAKTKIWYSGDLEIKPCKGCNACQKKDHGCSIKDDMQKLYKEIKKSDAIVLGSPVYMGQMSAQAKLFTDRLYALYAAASSKSAKDKTAKKKLVLVFTQGDPDESLYREYFEHTKKGFQILDFDVQSVHFVADTDKEPAKDRKGLKAEMNEIGAALALKTKTDEE